MSLILGSYRKFKAALAATKANNEWSAFSLFLALALTCVFTVANIYLGTKLGMSFATSIPAAVISMGLLQLLKRPIAPLQNNFIQTIASSAGAISNVFMVAPALILLGWWSDFHYWTTFLITLTGGAFGVLFTIPLRKAFINRSSLPYPEGVACAAVIQASIPDENGQTSLKPIVVSGLIAALFSFLTDSLHVVTNHISGFYRISNDILLRASGSFSLALVGTGYLMGFASCFAWGVGVLISWDVVLPYLQHATALQSTHDLITQGTTLWHEKVRLVGAGTIATSSLWILIKLAKPVLKSIQDTLLGTTSGRDSNLDKDIPPAALLGITLFFLVILFVICGWFLRGHFSNSEWLVLTILGVLSCVGIGMLVASACGYMAGLLGSSSSPISGIGVIAIIAIGSMMYALKAHHFLFSPEENKVLIAYSLFILSIIIASCAVANDNLQDLKTGAILKATPWLQEVALLIGCLTSALIIPILLNLLYKTYGFEGMEGTTNGLALPQASLLANLANATMFNHVEWHLLFIGALIGIISIAIDSSLGAYSNKLSFPPLALGLGVYLPGENGLPVIIGGVLSLLAKTPMQSQKILLVTGLIIGESLSGVGSAILKSVGINLSIQSSDIIQLLLGTVLFILIISWSYRKLRA